MLMQPAPGCSAKPFLRDENGGVVAFCNEKGRGRVITVAAPRMLPAEWLDAGRGEYKARLGGIISGAKQFSLVRFLLERVQAGTMPIAVDGNIQWGVNKTSDGWLVWLMNADGVEKFIGERQKIDISRTSVVNVRMKSGAPANVTDARTGLGVPTVGGAFQVNVMPGEWRIFKVTNFK